MPGAPQTRWRGPVRLPTGIAVSEDTDWSSIMALPKGQIPYQGKLVQAVQIGFRPSGAAALDPDEEWYLTAFHPRIASTPGDHFVTINIDPVTGSIVSHEP